MGAARRSLLILALSIGLHAAPGRAVSGDSGAAASTETHPNIDSSPAGDSPASDSDSATAPSSDEHRFGFGLALGYGYGVAPRDRQRGRDVADVRFLAINPHVRVRLWGPGDGTRWYKGALEGMLEGSVLINFEPHTGHAGGALAGLRYRILPGHRVQPYAEAGIGLGRLAFDLRSQDDGFTFFINAGAGVRWQLSEAISLTGAVRWHHISNAQLRRPNNGIDDVLFLIGVELW